MQADLCRRLAVVAQSPMYRNYSTRQNDPNAFFKQIEQVCINANTEDQLPTEMKNFFKVCDRSIEVADQKGFRYPYTQAQIEQVMEAMSDAN